ncbi:MAG TPA: hypothetical protein VNO35_32045 [Steroidobacteraceae bacterium]|nr:hypothetical protein [Steroidobacteraceae bacterium]
MRDIVANLMQLDNVNRFFGEMMSGLSTRYNLGSELDDVGRLIGDKLIGHGKADVSLYDVMQDGMGVLLDASTEGKASKLVAASTQRIRCVAVDTGPSMLIRPDACIVWTGEENSTDGLAEALRRWFSPVIQHLEPANWNRGVVVSVKLNHSIVWCRDKQRSAAFLTDILGLPQAVRFGPFLVVELENGVSLDFYSIAGDIASQHYAFSDYRE